MRARSILISLSATIVLSAAFPASAQARTTELVDRSLFDGAPERSAASLHLEGPTAGPLGGAMNVTVSAPDGTLPTTFGSCEVAEVTAVVTVSPGEVLTVSTAGEACAHIVDGTLQVNARFGARDVTYTGTEHTKAKLVGDGLIAAAHHAFGAQASFAGAFRW